MSTNFNWNTDEEHDWDDEEELIIEQRSRRRLPRWLIGGAILLAILIGVGFILLRTVNDQVDEVEEEVSLSVLDSVALVQQAAESGDVELFTGVLSGRAQSWSDAQKDLVRADLWLSRPQLGLRLISPAGSGNAPAPTDADVTLNPALQSAEVQLTHLYQVDIGNGVTQTVRLQQTVVYRQGETSWLYAPPTPEFWGEPEKLQSPYFEATYPSRDDELIQRLVRDLSNKFLEICTRGWIDTGPATCTNPTSAIELDFRTDPGLLIQLERQRFDLPAPESTLILPTPTLIGWPTNDASYQALFRGYASIIFGWLIQEAAGYECCEHRPFFEAILQLQLNQVGLQPWPLGEGQYHSLLREAPTFQTLALFSESRPLSTLEDNEIVYALALYRVQEQGIQPDVLMRRLAAADTLEAWFTVEASAEPFPFDAVFYERWQRFLHAQTALYRQPLLTFDNEQTLLLNCFDGRRSSPNATVLTRYTPGVAATEDLSFFNSAMFMIGLPDDKGVVLHENILPTSDLALLAESPTASRTIWWQNGLERLLNSAPIGAPRLTFTGETDPSGQILLVQSDLFGFNSIDLSTCENGCSATQLGSDSLRFSPDGRRSLQNSFQTAFQNDTPLIWYSDENLNGRNPLPDGSHPFWLDNDRYGYFVEQSVMVTSISDPGTTSAFAFEIERPESPIDNSQLPLEVLDIAQNPMSRNQLLVLLGEISRGRHFLIWLNASTGEAEVLFDSTFAPTTTVRAESMGFSGDGRWLQYVLDGNQGPDILYLESLSEGSEYRFDLPEATSFGYDWSADGAWLAINRGITIQLISLHSDEQWLVDLGAHLTCTQLAWQYGLDN